jgi:hypothetical protein
MTNVSLVDARFVRAFLFMKYGQMKSKSFYDSQRDSSAKRGYGRRWRKARITFLQNNPLCKRCEQKGRVTPAEVVDHIVPHKGDQKIFWDSTNWQALCKQCHDSFKQRYEKSGTIAGCDTNGIPLDPNHHWNKQSGEGG